MKRLVALLLAAVLLGGFGFFIGEYVSNAKDWIVFPGSPHVYTNGKVSAGAVTDRDNTFLVDLTDGRTYASEESFRMATLHWVGDRLGVVV